MYESFIKVHFNVHVLYVINSKSNRTENEYFNNNDKVFSLVKIEFISYTYLLDD